MTATPFHDTPRHAPRPDTDWRPPRTPRRRRHVSPPSTLARTVLLRATRFARVDCARPRPRHTRRPGAGRAEIQHWTAPTGARVHFVESRALPLVNIQVDFAAGTALDPADKAGLAS